MRKLVAALCVIAAVYVVACAAQQTAQDQSATHTTKL
jgi:hypothetical protein